MKPVLCIISVYRPHLINEVIHAVGGIGRNLQVVMDRRHGERRSPERASSAESRAHDRRQRNVEEELRTQGYAIVDD
jgi:hypothetical protein